MPQDVYPLQLDSTTILVDVSHIPGFDTFDKDTQDSIARQILKTILSRNIEEPATFADFAIPITFLVVFSLIILWIARKISKSPKLYDTIVKMDGEPNPEYGKGWRKKVEK